MYVLYNFVYEYEHMNSLFNPKMADIISNNLFKILKVIMFDNLANTRFKLKCSNYFYA